MLKSVSGYISISEFEMQRILGLEYHLLEPSVEKWNWDHTKKLKCIA